jgi:dipeptidyl aminopeptidase/acylaminoacyl peptidase
MPKKTYKIEDFLSMRSAIYPQWTFDDSQIIYLSDQSGTMQLFIVPAKGGKEKQLTDYSDPIINYTASLIKNEIVFSKAEKGNEQAQLYLLNIDTQDVIPLTKNKTVRHNLGSWSRDGQYISFSSTERNGTDTDVYVMDMETYEIRCVFSGGGNCHSAGFSPSARFLAVVQSTTSNTNNDLYLCNLETGYVKHLTLHTAGALYVGTAWLPDESAFFTNTNNDREFFGLARYDMQKEIFTYVFTPKWNVWGYTISRDGKQILITINEEGYSSASLHKTDTFETIGNNFLKGSFQGIDFSNDGKSIIYSLGDSRSTYNIYTRDLISNTEQQFTNSKQGVPKEELAEPELIHFSSFDNLSIPAFVYKPKYIPIGTKLPVIINIHGGPESQYRPGFNPFVQYFVYAGYVVVAPNVRGSAGYGKTYLALDDVENRMGSVKDIAALREYLVKLSYVDIDRVVLMGGSYGGFMVYMCLASYPDLWAGGVVTVGISNFITFLKNTASYRRAMREAEYGSLKHNYEFLESISPINMIDKITAPLFIAHGANDPRVPLSEAEQVVRKMEKQGKKVKLVVYPDEGHGITKHKNRADLYPKIISFLEQCISSLPRYKSVDE